MTIRVLAVLCVMGILASSCGGSESNNPTAPTPAPSTTPTPPVTTTFGLFTFTFPASMALAEQDLIRNTVLSGNTFFQTSMGRTVEQATTITASATDSTCAAHPGSTAYAQPGVVGICVGNEGWPQLNSLHKQKILIHELFHIVQNEMSWGEGNPNGEGPMWIKEGSAEYVGWRGVVSIGLVTWNAARGCNAKRASEIGAPAAASLDTLESRQGFNAVGWGYQFGMLGMDQLLLSRGLPALMSYGRLQAGTPWRTAFESAFGISTTAFYSGFPSYRAGLSSLASSQGDCREGS